MDLPQMIPDPLSRRKLRARFPRTLTAAPHRGEQRLVRVRADRPIRRLPESPVASAPRFYRYGISAEIHISSRVSSRPFTQMSGSPRLPAFNSYTPKALAFRDR